MLLGEKNCKQRFLSVGDQVWITGLLRAFVLTTSSTRSKISCVFRDSGSLSQSEGMAFSVEGSLMLSRRGQDTYGSSNKGDMCTVSGWDFERDSDFKIDAICSLSSWVQQSKLDINPVLLVKPSKNRSPLFWLVSTRGFSRRTWLSEEKSKYSCQSGSE